MIGRDLIALLVALCIVAAILYVATAGFVVVLLVGAVYFVWLVVLDVFRWFRDYAGSKR